jgi:hypothetical protein
MQLRRLNPCGFLRSLTAPAIDYPDGRVPKFCPANRTAPIRHKIYCVGAPRLPWSTLTPGPIVLETDTFLK